MEGSASSKLPGMKGEQLSHKMIEKKRRDRINNCLAELSQTVPAVFSKQTSGKLEKAEILEMTVEYMRAIQATELGLRLENGEWFSSDIWTDFMHHYRAGYVDCTKEILQYLGSTGGASVSTTCSSAQLLAHLQARFRPDATVVGARSFNEHLLHHTMAAQSSQLPANTHYMPYTTGDRPAQTGSGSAPSFALGGATTSPQPHGMPQHAPALQSHDHIAQSREDTFKLSDSIATREPYGFI